MHEPVGTETPFLVSVVIVTHNSGEEVADCLRGMPGSGSRNDLEVFVVDNASSDGTTRIVQDNFPWVQLMANSENLFFTRANNQAFSRAKGRYVLVLNPDTLLEPDTIDNMVRFMESHPEAGAASCLFVDSRGKIIPTCWRQRSLPWLLLSREPLVRVFGNSRVLRTAAMAAWDRLSEREVDVVSDAFLFARRSALQQVGLYDERFQLYLTEDDLCARLRGAGFKVLHNPGARICHLVSRSTKKRPMTAILKIQKADFVRYFGKHHGVGAAAVAWLACTAELLVWRSYLLVAPRRDRTGSHA
jgi:GT2 family glycosyltransferase